MNEWIKQVSNWFTGVATVQSLNPSINPSTDLPTWIDNIAQLNY